MGPLQNFNCFVRFFLLFGRKLIDDGDNLEKKKLVFAVAVALCFTGDARRRDRMLGNHGRTRRNVRITLHMINK